MILLDMRTLVFGNLVTDIVCVLVILLLWHQSRKRFVGTGFWAFDFSFQTAAMILILLRGSIPDWMSMVFSNTLVIGGAILGYMGLGRFVGKKLSQLHNYVLLVAFACVHAYFTLVQPSLAARNLNVTVGLLIICFQCTWLLLYRVEPVMRQFTRGVGMVFGAYCVVGIVRIVELFAGPHTANDYFRSGAFESLVLISYQMLFILLTYSLALMVNKRLLGEVETQEEKFAKAFNSSPYAITLTRLSDGQIVEINDGFLNISGYRYAEAIGKTTVDLHLWDKEEDRAVALDELSKMGKVQGREFQFRKKSGETFTGLFSAAIIPINDRKFVLSSISDIAERKRAEEALRESEEKYRNLVKYAPAAIYEMDLQGTKFLSVNEVMCDILRYSREELLSTKPSDLMDQESRTLFKERLRKNLAGEKIDETVEYRIRRKDGEWIYADINVGAFSYTDEKATHVVVIGHDITERKKFEEALRQSEERYRLLAETMLQGVVHQDGEGKIIAMNPAAEQILGKSREEFLGSSSVEEARHTIRQNGEPFPGMEHPAMVALRTCHQVRGVVMGVFNPKVGDYRWIMIDAVPVCRPGETRPSEVYTVFEDITERRQAEEALRRSRDELEIRVQERTRDLETANEELRHLSSRLMSAQEEERKRFAAEIHDAIGSCLSAIKFKVEAAVQQIGETAPGTTESLNTIIPVVQESINECRRIQMDLRPAMLDDLGLLPTLSWFCRRFQTIYSGIRVEQEIAIQENDIPQMLKIVVFRIIQEAMNNIAKHSRANLVSLSLNGDGKKIELAITDNGTGFDVENMLTQGRSSRGLGLESMRERAELSGGAFAFESARGKGTVIRASWPAGPQ